MGIDHKEKGFVVSFYLREKFGGKFTIQFFTAPIGHFGTVPTIFECILSGRDDVFSLAKYAGHETILEQGFRQSGYARFDLGKAKRSAVVGITTGHPDRPSGHANRNRYVAMLETQAFTGEFIDIGSRPLDFRTIDPDRVAVHVV